MSDYSDYIYSLMFKKDASPLELAVRELDALVFSLTERLEQLEEEVRS